MKILKKATGILFAVLFLITVYLQISEKSGIDTTILQYATIAELAICLICLLPGYRGKHLQREKSQISKRTLISAVPIFVLIPLTVFIGMYFLEDRKYYFISLLIILEVLVPFFAGFEKRKPRAREIIVISVLCGLAVAGRAAFYMLPQFKPVIALVIIAGVCLGGEVGFLTGAVTGFVSNFFFGQGPWTPWQMFAFGIIGFIAGVVFKKGLLPRNKTVLCIFGGIATVVLFGGITNPGSILMWHDNPTAEMFISAYVMGLPFDLLHALSTAFFLWFTAEPMIDKLERIKLKYDL